MSSPLIICGAQRSGTTLLATLLGGHPQVLAEPKVRSFGWITKLNHLPWLLAEQPGAEWSQLVDKLLVGDRIPRQENFMAAPNLPENADLQTYLNQAISTELSKKNKNIWLDKAPNMEFYFKDLLYYFPKVKIINMLRDGRAVAASRINRLGHTAAHAGQEWMNSTLATLAAKRIIPAEQLLCLRYEDLVRRPEESLEQVCKFLDIDFSPGLLQLDQLVDGAANTYVSNRFDQSKIDGWSSKLSTAQIHRLESIQGPILRELGYELRHPELLHDYRFPGVYRQIGFGLRNDLQLLLKNRSQGMKEGRTSTLKVSFSKRLRQLVQNAVRAIFAFDIYRQRYMKAPDLE